MKNKLIKGLAAVLAVTMLAGCTSATDTANESSTSETSVEAITETEASEDASTESTENADSNIDESTASDSTDSQVASSSEMASVEDVVEEGMTPVYASSIKPGTYEVTVDSSSSMFNITSCELTVTEDEMTAVMTMGGTGYLYVFMGTGEEAAAADEAEYISFVENENGEHTFTVPVEALDMGISVAAFSKKKEKWYDRTLLFRLDSLPTEAVESVMTTAEDLGLEDGEYTCEVSLEGGSGKASVTSPCKIVVADGTVTATIEWSSPNYDYMKVDDVQYDPVNTEGNSVFEIPVAGFDYACPVLADTTAMSTPHEIEYTLKFNSSTIQEASSDVSQMSSSSYMELKYAEEFTVEYHGDEYAIVTIHDTDKYCVVEEGATAPDDLGSDYVVIHKPIQNTYLASSSVMDFYRELGTLSNVSMTSTKESDWSISEVQEALESGDILYVGKYSAPDYELLTSNGCNLAIENTMIYHNPETKEKLEQLGIPVMVEYSSYENDPIGRLEWIKLYGYLTDTYDEAVSFFDSEVQKVNEIAESLDISDDTKTVAFFYINSNGVVNIRKPSDYISKMINIAGGKYAFENLDLEADDENALTTMNIQMEEFYEGAHDADILIYNSVITGNITTLSELYSKSELLAGFDAVKTGNVWCTEKNIFQQTTAICGMISDFYKIISGEADKNGDDELEFMHRLE